MIVGTAAEGPMIFAIVFTNGQIVDAGDSTAHVTFLAEFPVLISVGAEPVSGIVMPFVSKSNGDAILLKSPKFFDEAIVELLVPFTGKELNDGVASGEDFGTITPVG